MKIEWYEQNFIFKDPDVNNHIRLILSDSIKRAIDTNNSNVWDIVEFINKEYLEVFKGYIK